MAYVQLSEIDANNREQTIQVRASRIWDAINMITNELISIDIILIDEKESMIHAFVPKEQESSF
ncbi:hypothetical protein M5689_024810 [Euphorbia peplus]|nr:hypothetical protein M5689_024810 [Euphorbia peplus]